MCESAVARGAAALRRTLGTTPVAIAGLLAAAQRRAPLPAICDTTLGRLLACPDLSDAEPVDGPASAESAFAAFASTEAAPASAASAEEPASADSPAPVTSAPVASAEVATELVASADSLTAAFDSAVAALPVPDSGLNPATPPSLVADATFALGAASDDASRGGGCGQRCGGGRLGGGCREQTRDCRRNIGEQGRQARIAVVERAVRCRTVEVEGGQDAPPTSSGPMSNVGTILCRIETVVPTIVG